VIIAFNTETRFVLEGNLDSGKRADFNAAGLPLAHRVQVGLPYAKFVDGILCAVNIAGSYPLCGGGHMVHHVAEEDLAREHLSAQDKPWTFNVGTKHSKKAADPAGVDISLAHPCVALWLASLPGADGMISQSIHAGEPGWITSWVRFSLAPWSSKIF
jgi:hypothetical protein